MSNNVLVIHPYRDSRGIWRFDDATRQPGLDGDRALRGEPFVGDINRMIDDMIEGAGIRGARKGFTAYFSGSPIKGYHMVMKKVSKNVDPTKGADYYCNGMVGWLCPALAKYFGRAPELIYVKAEAAYQPRWWERLLSPCASR